MMRQIAVIVFALSLLSLPPAGAGAQQGCVLPAIESVDGQVTISGEGTQNTRPFDLAGGAYTVRWLGSAGAAPLPNLILYLKRTDSLLGSELLANAIVTPTAQTASGETQVYHVKPGAFYLAVTAPGPWSVTVSPQ